MSNPSPKTSLSQRLKEAQRKSELDRADRVRKKAEKAARVPGEGFEPGIVSFIDILGFRNLLQSRHAHDIRDAVLTLRKSTTPIEHDSTVPNGKQRKFSAAFTDSVSDAVVRVRVFDTEFADGAFFHEVLDLIHAQVECVGDGVLVRGGLAIGDIYIGETGEGPVFGSGMVRAYELEQHDAKYPRIVIDRDAFEKYLKDPRLKSENHTLQEDQKYLDALIREDTDGMLFIDYLRGSEQEFDEPIFYWRFLQQHAKMIKQGLKDATDNVRPKYEWLANYHNEVVHDLQKKYDGNATLLDAIKQEYGFDLLAALNEMSVTL